MKPPQMRRHSERSTQAWVLPSPAHQVKTRGHRELVASRHPVAIGLGANLGQPPQSLMSAAAALERALDCTQWRLSPLYDTAPLGPAQPRYVNAVAVGFTPMAPKQVLQACARLENEFGRQRLERWGPRTLDLDVLLYACCISDLPELTIPHPRLAERAFVLQPLCDLAPDWHVATLGACVEQLWRALECSLSPEDLPRRLTERG